jgi:alpha-beta hydrolase superfamily lysophospholipase
MSGVARPIDVVLPEQIRTLGKLQGGTPEQLEAAAAPYQKLFAAARNPQVPDSVPTGSGTTIGYWRDWMKRDPVRTMATLKVPSLVLRGTNDLNSTHEDFVLLSKAAAPRSASREFPGLNHEHFAGEGSATDQMEPHKVADAPMDAIAAWVRTGRLN